MDRRSAQGLIERLRVDADRISASFGLRYATIDAEHPNVKRRYGICYADGSIKIRLRHVKTGHGLKYSSLVSTLCHELAHLRHFDHSPRFHDFYRELLEWSRREGIYRPAPRRAAEAIPTTPREPALRRPPNPGAPEQLTLF